MGARTQTDTDLNDSAALNRGRWGEPVLPESTALLNVDVQNCFVESAAHGLETLARINRLARVCRQVGIIVLHTRHVLRSDGSDMGLLGEFSTRIKAGMLSEDAESSALHPALDVDDRDLVIHKPRFGAFFGTELDEALQRRGIDSVMVAGISTDVCCDTTAREAHARDLRVLFLSDGTAVAGPNPVDVQARTLRFIGAMFGEVISVDAMIQKIEEGAATAQ
jgi:nicotinamidase-related amidase